MSTTHALQGGETPVKEPDRELVQRAQRYEPEALAEAFDTNFERIYSFVFAAVGDDADAEELTGQVFLKALDALPTYRAPGPGMTAFLYRLAQSVIAQRLRDAARQLPAAEPVGEPDHVELIRRALSEVGDAASKVLMFRFLAGMDSEEIAHVTGFSHARVLALQHRGLKAMHASLQKNGVNV